MRLIRLLLLIPAVLLLGLTLGLIRQDSPSPAPPQLVRASVPKARVIIQINRYNQIQGFVEDEDDAIIVVRDQRDQLHSLAKSGVLKIVRLVDVTPGQPGSVILKDGQRHEGNVISDDFDAVVIEVQGIRARYVRAVVDYVVLEPTFEERYAAWKRSLDSYNAVRHMELCRWLYEQRKYKLAEQELVDLLRRQDAPAASELLKIVRAQLALVRNRPEPEQAPEPNPPGPADAEHLLTSAPLPTLLIGAEEVNLMRVYEIDFSAPPRVAIDTRTIQDLIAAYADNKLIPADPDGRAALLRADPLQIVRLMFELRAREFYGRVKVVSEPQSLNLFRMRVHNTWLINSCASAACHGGTNAGRFFLHSRNFRDERTRYTNLLILERLKLDEEWPLINYDQPGLSLIVQHALPRNTARRPHPDVPGWKPAFTRADRRMLDGTFEWIDSMMQPRPQYPVHYDPPMIGQPPPAPSKSPDDPAPPAPGGESDEESK